MKEIRIYFEGDDSLRSGFQQLFRRIRQRARERRIRLRFIAGGATPIQDFFSGLVRHPNAVVLLLVDAEGPDDGQLRAALRTRGDWKSSANVSDEQIWFMVETMENWLLGDREAIARYYGHSFYLARLPQNPTVDRIPKDTALRALREASRETKKGPYHKTRHAPALLSSVNLETVIAHSDSCREFADHLDKLVAS